MKNKTLFTSLLLSFFLVVNFLQAQEKNEPTAQTEQTFVAGKYTVKYFLDGRKVTKVPKIDILTKWPITSLNISDFSLHTDQS